MVKPPFAGLAIVAAAWVQVDPSAVPVEKEPSHRLVFANEFVRVIDARFPAGHVTLKHTHAADNVAVTITPGREGAEAEARIGRAGFNKGGYSHAVTNAGASEQRFVDVEILKGDRPNAPPALDEAQHKLEFENERARIYRVTLGPGETITPHTHHAGWIAVVVRGEAQSGGPGTFRWYGAGESNSLGVLSQGAPLEIVELEPR